MSVTGFYINRLTLKGPNVPDAEVQFKRGLNVVVGVSDTGKTFIAQCINFMFGGSRKPRDIPEAKPYDTVCLALCVGDAHDEWVLERSLRGGDFKLNSNKTEERVLKAQHKPQREDTVSHFLLGLAGLLCKKIRMNQAGKTRPLSFRDIVKLVLVDETSVIADRSPIFSGQSVERTGESSVFRFLLTGIDDSSVVAQEEQKIAKARREGKSKVIEELLIKAREQAIAFNVDGEASELREQLTRLEASIEGAAKALVAEQQSATVLEDARREACKHLHVVDSHLAVLVELKKRFELLQKQYESDLHRLESISEASFRLGQMKEERCPVCGALAEHHNIQHQSPLASPDEVAISCNAEVEKIRTLLLDLQGTLSANDKKIECLTKERLIKLRALNAASTQLQESLQPRIQAALQTLQGFQAQRDKVRRTIELLEHVRELEELLGESQNALKRERAENPSRVVGTDEAENFSREVETLLRCWNFPGLERVTFSEKEQDIVISGQQRASHGKGVRAITHAAFNLAMLKYCQGSSKPHPGLVLIDSPLIVYKQPDMGEESFTHDVKDGFYRTLSTQFGSAQVIILENEEPPADLEGSINIIRFTGTNHGRRGFIPVIG